MEWWANNTGLWAAVFTAIAALLGVASWVLSGWVADAKDAALRKFQDESKVAVAEATKGTAEAVRGTAVAQSDAAAANERSKSLELDVLRQQERAAKAEKELAELQERLRPRSIPAPQMFMLTSALRTVANKAELAVGVVTGDPEATAFAEQFATALRDAGWTIRGFTMMTTGRGVGLVVRNPNAVPAWVTSLADAFGRSGFQFRPHANAALEPFIGQNEALLAIMSKPQ